MFVSDFAGHMCRQWLKNFSTNSNCNCFYMRNEMKNSVWSLNGWLIFFITFCMTSLVVIKIKWRTIAKLKKEREWKKRPYTLTLFPTRQKSQNYCYRFAQSHTWTNTVAIVIILLNICCRNRNRDKNTPVTTHIISVQEVNGFE